VFKRIRLAADASAMPESLTQNGDPARFADSRAMTLPDVKNFRLNQTQSTP
jgi:hypothetical protein